MPFSEEIRTKFKDSKMTLAQLADLCDISESSASRYVNGKVSPPADVAEKILEVLKENTPEKPAEPKQLHEVYEAQIADLKKDKKCLFIALMVLTAVLVYFFLDAMHGWGLIRYTL